MTYRIFKRTWWADTACTLPDAGRKIPVMTVDTEAEAREFCKTQGEADFGPTRRGVRGMAYEYERN